MRRRTVQMKVIDRLRCESQAATLLFALLLLASAHPLSGAEPVTITNPDRLFYFTSGWEISEGSGSFTDHDYATENLWMPVYLPLSWSDPPITRDDGLRLRTAFIIPENLKNFNFGIYTGVIRYTSTFYINGVFVGELGNHTQDSYPGGLWDSLGYFFIPSTILRFGEKNTITIKVLEHYSKLNFTGLSVSGINSIEQLYFIDNLKYKLLHFLAGMICLILFFPLFYYYLTHKKEYSYLFAFSSGINFAIFSFLVSFDIPPFDFSLFYGIAMVCITLSITFITLSVWAFYNTGPKPIAIWASIAIVSLLSACVYFFLNGYRARSTYHMFQYLLLYVPQYTFLIIIVSYNQFKKRNNQIQIIFVGMLFLIATSIYDIIYDLTGRAPLFWMSPIGVIGFTMSLYIQIANKYIEDIKTAEQDSMRIHYSEALMSEKERLDVTLNSITDAVICTDKRGFITLSNRAASEVARTDDSMISKSLSEVLRFETDEENPKVIDPLSLLAPDDNQSQNNPVTCILRQHDDQRFPVHITHAAIKDMADKTIGLVWVLHDMTERERLEKIRQRNQTLESLSHLAGGIAHDFNNILTGMMLNLNLVKKLVPNDHLSIGKLILETERSTEKASTLTQQLSAFARGGMTTIQYRDLRPIVTSSVSYALGGANARVYYNFPDDLWYADVDAGQISQVIYALVINALQSITREGEIRITGENIVITEEMPFIRKGPYAVIKVEDNGIGIKKENLGRIFDPYFTTKQRGSGMGLTNAYLIIKKHGGHIEISSEENRGTTVTIYLRATKPPVKE
jgi:signal transduction histidine kinase